MKTAKRIGNFGSLTVIIALGINPFIAINTTSAAEQSTMVDEMTVEGRKIEERLSGELADIGHQVEVIEGVDIEKGGFVDLNQALEALVPGLFLSVKSGRGDYANVKLHGSGEVLWLLDGVRLNNRLYGTGYLDSITVKMIDRIEILKGGEGLFYGTDSQAGIINIITKSVTEETSGQAGVAYGSHDYKDVHAFVSDTIKSNGFMLFGSHEGWKGYSTFSTDTYDRVNNPNHEERGYGRTIVGGKYQREFNIGEGATIKAHIQRNSGGFDFARPNEAMAVNDRTEDIQFIKWDHDLTESFSYYIKAFNHRWWTDYTRQKLDGTYLYNDSEWGYEDRGVNIMGSKRFNGHHEVLFGYDYQNYWAKDDVWHIAEEKEDVNAFFLQLRPHLSFSPETKISLGARYNKTGGNDITIYNASIRTPVIANINFRGVIGTNFGLPTAEQLYLDEDGSQGNPDLKPEESYNIDVGFDGSVSIFTWGIGYFYQKIEDAISNTSDWSSFENSSSDTTIDGFELQLKTQIIDEVSFLTSLTTVDAHTNEKSVQLDRTPEYVVKANLQYRQLTGQYGADLTTRYVGDMVQRGYEAYEPYDNEIDYGNYFLADISGFYSFGSELQHRFTLRLENIFNEAYATRINKLSYNDTKFTYETEGLPFTATLNYSYRF